MAVVDDGRGFDLAAIRPESMGLRIMRERADEIGASVALESSPGVGTHVTVSWPRPSRTMARRERPSMPLAVRET